MRLRLFNYFRSSASYRVRIGLAWKGLAYDYVPVHLVREGGLQHSAEHQARNPMAQVPVLEVTTDDGRTLRVAQSLAILELLEELVPSPSMWPSDPFDRAQARELAELINSGVQPHQNLAPMKRIDALSAGAGRLHAQHFNRMGLAAYEARVRALGGVFSVGSSPTIADMCLVPQLATARRFEIDLSPYPTLLAIETRCLAQPAFQAAAPDRQPDHEP